MLTHLTHTIKKQTLTTLSDGIAVENPHFLCENQAKLKRMQRHLSRKKLGSNRRNKCRLKVSRLHRDIANKRSRCGWKNKDLKLSDRTFVCKDCGMEIDRDLNAAINIQAVGVDAAIRTQSSRVASCVEASKME